MNPFALEVDGIARCSPEVRHGVTSVTLALFQLQTTSTSDCGTRFAYMQQRQQFQFRLTN